MDEAFNPCELVEFDIGPIILDPFDCSYNKVSDFREDDLRSLGGHSPALCLAQRLYDFSTNLGFSTCRLGQQVVADCAFHVTAGSLENNLLVGAFQALHPKEYATRFWN